MTKIDHVCTVGTNPAELKGRSGVDLGQRWVVPGSIWDGFGDAPGSICRTGVEQGSTPPGILQPTPAEVYKALFLGILGAVVLRLAFYWVGSEFFRLAWVVQLIFGVALVWSGYQTATSGDEEDEDPRQSLSVRLITRRWLGKHAGVSAGEFYRLRAL